LHPRHQVEVVFCHTDPTPSHTPVLFLFFCSLPQNRSPVGTVSIVLPEPSTWFFSPPQKWFSNPNTLKLKSVFTHTFLPPPASTHQWLPLFGHGPRLSFKVFFAPSGRRSVSKFFAFHSDHWSSDHSSRGDSALTRPSFATRFLSTDLYRFGTTCPLTRQLPSDR